MDVRVANVVATALLPHGLDLEAVRSVFCGRKANARYDGFPTGKNRLVVEGYSKSNPRAKIFVYSTGKMVLVGARSTREAVSVLRRFVSTLKREGVHVRGKPEIRISNVVALADLGGTVDLYEAHEALPGTVYDPEQFPGLIYHPDGSKSLRLLVFNNGKVVCSGARSEDEARRAISWLYGQLESMGLIFLDGQEPSVSTPKVNRAKKDFKHGQRTVSVPLPDRLREGLEELVRQGRYPSVSEAVRMAVRDLLSKELWG